VAWIEGRESARHNHADHASGGEASQSGQHSRGALPHDVLAYRRDGHSDPQLTLGVYTHAVSEDGRLFAVEMGRVLDPSWTLETEKGIASGTQPLLVQ
jgi:hypothetical protein